MHIRAFKTTILNTKNHNSEDLKLSAHWQKIKHLRPE